MNNRVAEKDLNHEGHQFKLKNVGIKSDKYYCSSRYKHDCKASVNQFENRVELSGSHNDACKESQKREYPAGKTFPALISKYFFSQLPTHPHFSFTHFLVQDRGANFTTEMRDKVDTYAKCDITKNPDEIWRILAMEFQQQAEIMGSATYKGMTHSQVKERVKYIRRRDNQTHIDNDIFNSPLANVKGSDQFFFNNQCIGVALRGNPPRTESAISWANPALLCILRMPGIHLFVDGTFRCVPKGFAQCLIVMAYDETTKAYVPIMYTLMTSQTESLYSQVFRNLIVASNSKMTPNSVTCDFEVAMSNSLKSTFQLDSVNGCLFHFKQALRRYLITKLGFSKNEIGAVTDISLS